MKSPKSYEFQLIIVTEKANKCKPKLALCSDVDNMPLCMPGRYWIHHGFNKTSIDPTKKWKIVSPLMTTRNHTNCNFVIFEYPRHSRAGRTEKILPGTSKDIPWNIRSLKKTRA